MRPSDLAKIRRYGEHQLGLLSIGDLRKAGIGERQISRLAEYGFLIRVYRGVYKLADSTAKPEQDVLAAVMACGPDAVACGITAAEMWGLVERRGRRLEVAIPINRRVRREGINVRRSTGLSRADMTKIGPVPVTRVVRTLEDVARTISRDDLDEACDVALRKGLITPERLAASGGTLHEIAIDRRAEGIPESRLETRAIAVLRRYALPDPKRQHRVQVGNRNYRLDLAYPAHRIGIELEGRIPHTSRERWESDHERRRALDRAGWRVLSFTWRDVTEREIDMVLYTADALGLTPTRWKARSPSRARRSALPGSR